MPAAEAPIEIGENAYDSERNDNSNLNDEWGEFNNEGTDPGPSSAWGVKDESASHRYTFPDGLTLAPDAAFGSHRMRNQHG